MNSRRRLFVGLIAFYVVVSAIFVGISSQGVYAELSDVITETTSDAIEGGFGTLGETGLLLASGLAGTFSPQLSDVQQVFSALLFLLIWLTTVWLLRAILSGRTPRLRDGLYNAGSPIVPTAILFGILLIQLLPAVIAIIFLNVALSTSLLASGLIAMVTSVAVVILVVVSMYWATGTFIALIIITLPGMFPWQAMRVAGDLVIGRRMRILLRITWLIVGNLLLWIVIILPAIIIDRWIKDLLPALDWIPIVPIAIGCISAFIAVWSAAYVFLLYRKVVDDDAAPA